jgi:hypothetical protein
MDKFNKVNVVNRSKRDSKLSQLKSQLEDFIESYTEHLGFLVDGGVHNLVLTIQAPLNDDTNLSSFVR